MNGREKAAWRDMLTLLVDLFGDKRGSAYCDCARRQEQIWLQATSETSPSRLKTMRETILPRIAVYAVIKDNGEDADTALGRYVREIAGPKMHKIYAGAEKVPFFYDIFSRAMVHITEKSDLWDCASKREKDRFTLNIHKCLWHETCMKCGYPEACRFFCECDEYTYGDLRKIGFTRAQTLGTGGKLCDFTFYRKEL